MKRAATQLDRHWLPKANRNHGEIPPLPARMAKRKQKHGKQGASVRPWGDREPCAQLLWRTVQRLLQTSHMGPPDDPAAPLPCTEPKDQTQALKQEPQRGIHGSSVTTVKSWKAPKCPPEGERVQEMWSIHTVGVIQPFLKGKERAPGRLGRWSL